MAAFLGRLTIAELDADMLLWELVEPLCWQAANEAVEVPAGFITDFASIPPPLHLVLPRWGRYGRACVLHDYLCVRLDAEAPHPAALTRRRVDALFYDALIATGNARLLALAMWAAVRVDGVLAGLRRSMAAA